jgi:hypothetical protein
MSIQVIRENAWVERKVATVISKVNENISNYPNEVARVWNTFINDDSPSYLYTRIPRDLRDWSIERRENIPIQMERYNDFIDTIDDVLCDFQEEFNATNEYDRLQRYIEKHYRNIGFHDYINTWDTKTVYHLEDWYKQAYKSHTMLINWVKKNENAYYSNIIICMLRAKQCIMYYDLIRAEIHRRLCFPSFPVRTERVVETKKINQVPQFIKELLITTMKEQNKTYDCPICMDTLQAKDIKFSGCGHMYCSGCLLHILGQGKCAVCRESIE